MTPDLSRLAAAVADRRLQLNLSVRRASEMADVAKGTWMRIEDGQPVRHMTYDKVEQTLGWSVGSCRKVMDGGEAVLLDEPEGRSIAPVPADELEGEISQAISGAMVAGTDLNASKIREINEQVLALLRARGILPPAE